MLNEIFLSGYTVEDVGWLPTWNCYIQGGWIIVKLQINNSQAQTAYT